MTDTNNIIQSLWIGKALSDMEQLCIESYLQNGHAFHLYAYAGIENVPAGTVLCNANEVIHHSRIFLDNRGSVASFADWFRYQLLYEKGGWWVDMDTVCLQYFSIEAPCCFVTEGAMNGREGKITNGYIKSYPGNSILKDCLEFILAADHGAVQWGSFGPALLQEMVQRNDGMAFVQPPAGFNPVHWFEMYKLITRQENLDCSRAFGVHLWNEIWRLGYLDKNATYHPDSLYERLKRTYLLL
ncbi:MAG: glycosyltransferase [Candidatus Pseudobacter hemicellulosilyticus]|uniref:Glycosyltransferase n=1 Tax=Candidatus Pseudobacter hemicellulosilyticus TaxID=3121375 RepID=A0AAJ5WNA9_9BACT|nr:MAG: glycosyltransferase [Pseudobacter sp.]